MRQPTKALRPVETPVGRRRSEYALKTRPLLDWPYPQARKVSRGIDSHAIGWPESSKFVWTSKIAGPTRLWQERSVISPAKIKLPLTAVTFEGPQAR
jgi:hypothetical protein